MGELGFDGRDVSDGIIGPDDELKFFAVRRFGFDGVTGPDDKLKLFALRRDGFEDARLPFEQFCRIITGNSFVYV